MKFIAATKNKKKLNEIERILKPLGCELVLESELDTPFPEVVEDADTFEGNALKKARSAVKATGYAAIADDSGLCVDYLDGAPGIYSARFAGEEHDDEQNIIKLLQIMKNVEKNDRTAQFVSCVAVAFPNGEEFTVRGICKGYIAFEKQGDSGFGYDPVFVTEQGCFGTMTAEQKDAVSHRGKALKLMQEKLKQYL